MRTTPVYFHTNVDCCKRLVSQIGGHPINPLVGDDIIIHEDSKSCIKMRVVSRTWKPAYSYGDEKTVV